MSRVFVTGDLHGDILKMFTLEGELLPKYQDLVEGDILIIAGDFCLMLESVEGQALLDRLEQQPFCTCYVDGNHEDFPYLARSREVSFCDGVAHELRPGKVYHLMRGEFYRINGFGILTFGGAASQDKIWRQPGKTWYPEEIPSAEDYARCERTLAATPSDHIDFVISHTAPTSVCGMMLRGKVGGEDLPLTNYLEELSMRLPKTVQFLFGHFHEDKSIGRFRALMWDVVMLEKEHT